MNHRCAAGIASALLALAAIAPAASAVEIVLPGRTAVVAPHLAGEQPTPRAPLDPEGTLPERLERELRSRVGGATSGGGSTGFRVATLVRATSAFGEALAGSRPLAPEDRTVLGTVSAATLALAAFFLFFPKVAGWTVAALLAWVGMTGTVRAWRDRRRAQRGRPRVTRSSDGPPIP